MMVHATWTQIQFKRNETQNGVEGIENLFMTMMVEKKLN